MCHPGCLWIYSIVHGVKYINTWSRTLTICKTLKAHILIKYSWSTTSIVANRAGRQYIVSDGSQIHVTLPLASVIMIETMTMIQKYINI